MRDACKKVYPELAKLECIDIFKVVWENLRGDWSPEGDREYPDEHMKHRMIKVAQVAAQMMESCGLHGFVYTSQVAHLDFSVADLHRPA